MPFIHSYNLFFHYIRDRFLHIFVLIVFDMMLHLFCLVDTEELFMDYGRDYDRSSYARIVEEEEEVSAPIVETKVVKPVAVAAAVPVAAPVPVRAAPVKTVSESEGAVSVPSPSTSIFDSLIGNTKKSDIGTPSFATPLCFTKLLIPS